MATLAALQTQLSNIETAISNASVQSYSITGSHSVTNAAVSTLVQQANQIRRRIYRLQGYTSRTIPNFENDGSDDDVAGVPID